MNFRFCLFPMNDKGRWALADLLDLVGGQLRALGHTAVIVEGGPGEAPSFALDGDAVNIVLDVYVAEHVAIVAAAHRAGARIAYLATEQPTAQGWNFGLTPLAAERMAGFTQVAPYVDAIWPLVPGAATMAWYRQFGKPVAYLDIGHVPGLAERLQAEPVAKDYPFGAFGSGAPRRLEVLKRLSMHGRVHATNVILPPERRNFEMRRCKVGVEIRPYDETELVSATRCAMFLHLGLPVVGDSRKLREPWGSIVKIVDRDEDFNAACVAAAKIDRRLYRQQWRRFTERLSPARCMGQVIARTLAQ